MNKGVDPVLKSIRHKTLCIILSGLVLLTALGVGFAHAENVSGYDIVAYARTFLGYPYERGAAGPGAFDCSGFVYYVFRHFGIELPHGSYYFFNDPESYGTVVGRGTYANARVGDVVAWSGHVGIYTQDGTIVEALNRKYGVCERFDAESHPSGRNFVVVRIDGVVPFRGVGEGVTEDPELADFDETIPPSRSTDPATDEAGSGATEPASSTTAVSNEDRGDVNGDGKISSKDARLVLRAAAKLEELFPEQIARADVTGDGKVNSRDARRILRAAAKLETIGE